MLCPDLETLAWWTTKPIEQIDVEAVKHVVPSLERLAGRQEGEEGRRSCHNLVSYYILSLSNADALDCPPCDPSKVEKRFSLLEQLRLRQLPFC